MFTENHFEVLRNVRHEKKMCIIFCGRDFIYIWTVTNVYCHGVQRLQSLYTGGSHLETFRQDVVGCHGEDWGSCWDTGERTTGSSNVNVGVWQRCVRVHTMLHWK